MTDRLGEFLSDTIADAAEKLAGPNHEPIIPGLTKGDLRRFARHYRNVKARGEA